jgi:hypothetical protein
MTRQTRAIARSKRQTSYEVLKLTIAGAIALWATTIATSLLPIAAEYRAAFSISYPQVILVESLLAGLIIGCCVSYSLLLHFDKIPTKNPILKSVILSFVALVIAMVIVQAVASLLVQSAALHYLLVGAALNVPRFLFLGMIIGYLYKRLHGMTGPKNVLGE